MAQATTQRVLGVAIAGRALALLILVLAAAAPAYSQSDFDLQRFFRQDAGLSADEVAAIRSGKPIAKAMPSRTPAELVLFGAIYIQAAPESYFQFARDLDRRRALPAYWALQVCGNPPQLSDFKSFFFDDDEIQDLKKCRPGNCEIQLPASSIQEFQRSITWSAADANERVNRLLRKMALQALLAYQREGNQALGAYHDKREPAVVPQQFAYLLSYTKALPAHLPDFYAYLLAYPNAKPANVEDTFYWARVKFGLKPTLRVVQMVTMRGTSNEPVAYAIAEKQLYSSHYFETALDLSFCIPARDRSKRPGFYLVMAMGSEQAGLTGAKGAIIRKAAIGRSVSSLQSALTAIKNELEGNQ